jgi:hypothetical protein
MIKQAARGVQRKKAIALIVISAVLVFSRRNSSRRNSQARHPPDSDILGSRREAATYDIQNLSTIT